MEKKAKAVDTMILLQKDKNAYGIVIPNRLLWLSLNGLALL